MFNSIFELSSGLTSKNWLQTSAYSLTLDCAHLKMNGGPMLEWDWWHNKRSSLKLMIWLILVKCLLLLLFLSEDILIGKNFMIWNNFLEQKGKTIILFTRYFQTLLKHTCDMNDSKTPSIFWQINFDVRSRLLSGKLLIFVCLDGCWWFVRYFERFIWHFQSSVKFFGNKILVHRQINQKKSMLEQVKIRSTK